MLCGLKSATILVGPLKNFTRFLQLFSVTPTGKLLAVDSVVMAILSVRSENMFPALSKSFVLNVKYQY